MRLWRVSGTPWERHGQATRWFNARTPAIAVFHDSPVAAVCARLVHQRRHTPEALNPEECLYSISVNQRQVQVARVSRHWYDNLKETRSLVAAWRLQTVCPVLKVPTRDGHYQYLVNLRLPLLSEIPVRTDETHPFRCSARKTREFLREGSDWLVLP
ncbi:hypothetical protein B7P02_15650 [Bordetella bronchiseptica]|uniref:hypothetical protein n=1 Tax=Bordetella bronchiseptica TaxID=518 RepID=UPI000D725F62|nr:hypothetical protein [Bordetella bronchiseptica]AWP59360.1 hypothetical protein B7P02_15650 [Bordetella bronchiseptica]